MINLSKKKKKAFIITIIIILLGMTTGMSVLLWAAAAKIPVPNLDEVKVTESTKIYDRDGILLYDIHSDIRRTVIPFERIPRHVKNATVAIEDDQFYQHKGVSYWSILRAFLVNITSGTLRQGGSTITQQLIKNVLLTPERTISRKLKEFILALKIEKHYGKDKILSFYLNEIPYGSNIYGVEAASKAFFGKSAEELTLAESAYLASLPKAPSYYSPYGRHREQLEERKNLVLKRMQDLGFITQEEMEAAKEERPKFLLQKESTAIKAPHFVMFVKQYLNEKYGEDIVTRGGLKVITTLDWKLQSIAEDLVRQYAEEIQEKFNAYNAGLVGIDPKTGQITVMVGSRDWLADPLPEGCKPGIDCKFEPKPNVTNYGQGRQPGSSIKPFVYAAAFKKGFPPDTVVFDLPTEFNPLCKPDGSEEKDPAGDPCYHPKNYDDKFRGPVSLKEALAQSINLPSVKVLYLAGLNESLATARDFGIATLNDPNRYGLTLVLGGGEVKLLEMTSAYSAFANDGLFNRPVSVLRVENSAGKTLEEFKKQEKKVINENIARMVSDILSDNEARSPAFGERSYLYFPERQVAVKTGTTNDYRDAWVVGYAPNFSLGLWIGNNDNSAMEKRVAGFIAAPLWNAFFKEVFKTLPEENFNKPEKPNESKPVLRGEWSGGQVYFIDSVSGKLATDFTPKELIKERVVTAVHSILYWVDKQNVLGPYPQSPENDSQFDHWEFPVKLWAETQGIKDGNDEDIPKEFDDIHKPEYSPVIKLVSPDLKTAFSPSSKIKVNLALESHFPISQVDFFLTNRYLGSVKNDPFEFSLNLSSFEDLSNEELIRVVAYDTVKNSSFADFPLQINF